MAILYHPIDQTTVDAWRAGGPDDYGAAPERMASKGEGNPCRSCLVDIPEGREMLLLSHRPFSAMQPYAETGPIFVCAACEKRESASAAPPVVESRKSFLLKPYTTDERIAAPGGRVVQTAEIDEACEAWFARDDVAYVDIRSDMNNCFICRVTRG